MVALRLNCNNALSLDGKNASMAESKDDWKRGWPYIIQAENPTWGEIGFEVLFLAYNNAVEDIFLVLTPERQSQCFCRGQSLYNAVNAV